MKKLIATLAIAVGTCAAILPAMADCSCACVNGSVQAICSSSIDIEPICAPRVCPITPPSVAPIQMPTIPPIGTSHCHQVQVLNTWTHQYEWQQVCQ
jgi:hypothetical protein